MASTTYYVALPFAPGPDGPVPGEPIECQSALSAKATARALSHTSKYVGAIAFQRTGEMKVNTVAPRSSSGMAMRLKTCPRFSPV